MYTTADNVKTYLDITKTDKDESIEALIKEVSNLIDTYCGRSFARDQYEQNFFVIDAYQHFFLPNTPIHNISDILIDGESKINDIKYFIDQDTGQIIFQEFPFVELPAKLTVLYEGGYDPIPADIELACKLQTAYFFQRRHTVGAYSVSAGKDGGQIKIADAFQLLASVKEILDMYKWRRI